MQRRPRSADASAPWPIRVYTDAIARPSASQVWPASLPRPTTYWQGELRSVPSHPLATETAEGDRFEDAHEGCGLPPLSPQEQEEPRSHSPSYRYLPANESSRRARPSF